MLLEIKNVSSGYSDVTVLFDINLKVDQGELITVIGSNGAGKTTLLRTISGILKPKSGEIIFNGERIDLLESSQIAAKFQIAHVPEGRMLFPRMTVFQNLEIGAYTIKDRNKREEILKKIFDLFPKLHERSSQLAGTLSGGEQQMLAIGRGLMLDPQLLILDEPSLGVQPNIVKKIYETVKQINQKGTTVMIVEQNVKEALEISDRAYIIQTGKIITEGLCKDLLNSEIVRKAYFGI